MLLFAENPKHFVEEFSNQFLTDFIQVLKKFKSKVSANFVYQEYIDDPNHIHMNSTRWNNLSGLCRYLAAHGIAKVDEEEKGLMLHYIQK